MDPTILRSFVLVARHSHLGRAATELHLCKPAVSAHLKELERLVRHALFDRTPTGMQLTGTGERLLPYAQRALDAIADFDTAARQGKGRLSGRMDLGLSDDPLWVRAPQALAFLQRHHPDLTIRLRWCEAGRIQRDILEGRLTAGWLVGTVEETGLTSRQLTPVPLRVVAPQAWSRQIQAATLVELADFPWIDAPEGGALTIHRQQLFAPTGGQPTRLLWADTERAVYGLAAEGLAVGLLREDLALAGQRAGDLCLWPGTVPDLHLRFVLPMIRRDEDIGRALADAVDRSWAGPLQAPVRKTTDQAVSATLNTGSQP